MTMVVVYMQNNISVSQAGFFCSYIKNGYPRHLALMFFGTASLALFLHFRPKSRFCTYKKEYSTFPSILPEFSIYYIEIVVQFVFSQIFVH